MERTVVGVTLAFRGVLVDLEAAEQAAVYDLARRHGEAPLDRGRALARRLRALQSGDGLVSAYGALAHERGYRWAPPASAAVARIVAACRPFTDVCAALDQAARAGLPVAVVADADAAVVEAVLRPLDGAFAAVVEAPAPRVPGGARDLEGALRDALRLLDLPAERVLHVGASTAHLRAADAVGARMAWLARGARHAPEGVLELRGLDEVAAVAAGGLVAAG